MQASTASAGWRNEYGQGNPSRVLLKSLLSVIIFFLIKPSKWAELWILLIILHRWIPKAQLPPLHPERMCISNIAPVDVSETYNLFYCVYSTKQSNSQFFCDFQAQSCEVIVNGRTIKVFSSATLIMVYGEYCVWEPVIVRWFTKSGITVLKRKCSYHRYIYYF